MIPAGVSGPTPGVSCVDGRLARQLLYPSNALTLACVERIVHQRRVTMKTCALAADAPRAGHRRHTRGLVASSRSATRYLRSRIRLRMRSGVPVLVVLLLAAFHAAPAANASLDRGLCSSNASRGSIPASFSVDACFDGQTLHIYNNTTVPLGVAVQGEIGSPKRKET